MQEHLIIENFLKQRYPRNGRQQAIRDKIVKACNMFVNHGLADANFSKELCSGSEQKFWSCVSEALLAASLSEVGLAPKPSQGGGPDFLMIENGRNIWIEIICPEPKGVPLDWLTIKLDMTPVSFPHEQILLRWTSAIKEKAEKLIGSFDGRIKGYIEKGIVASGDAYVIAVNGCQLRNGPFPTIEGISQFPFAVEAVFAVGPYQITINRDTLKKTGSGHQHRPLLSKPKGAPVPTDTFHDEKFLPINAIWAVDVKGTSAIGNLEPMAVIHNQNAVNPIPIGYLPAYDEYVVTPIETESFELKKHKGCLSP